jgi:hypothetical protein
MHPPVVAMAAAAMACVSGMTTPLMDARTSVMGAFGDGRRARPDGGCRAENARNDEAYENQKASHGMDPSF